MTATGSPSPSAPPSFWPAPPITLNELDIPPALVQDLFLLIVRQQGQSSFATLADRTKLPPSALEPIFRQLRQQQYLDVKGMQGDDYHFALTTAGKALAAERAGICSYAGPAPVSLEEYDRGVRAQAAHVRINRDSLRQALSDLVLPDRLLDQLGPALISQRSLFLYGPTGNGKTSIAERLLRIYDDAVLVPYAIELSGRIITLFDPVLHQPLEDQPDNLDARWVLCHRPCITSGGELISEMLELRTDGLSGIYAAPLQMKANDGILVIDDFGRQVISPRDLLNRWIVPLDRRVDYLTLLHGQKLCVPFEMMVVFATNLDPSELADEAFLRRIHNKIYIEPVSEECFRGILTRVLLERQIAYEEDAIAHVVELCLHHSETLRACFPGDLCDILLWRSQYEGRAPQLTREELECAAELYFTRGQSGYGRIS
jgi:DNA-binding MarR family transcriptional regulator